MDEEFLRVIDTSSVSRQAAATFPHWGRQIVRACHICGGRARPASGGLFDEPIGSACGMPQGGYRKPPARLVVMTCPAVAEALVRANLPEYCKKKISDMAQLHSVMTS